MQTKTDDRANFSQQMSYLLTPKYLYEEYERMKKKYFFHQYFFFNLTLYLHKLATFIAYPTLGYPVMELVKEEFIEKALGSFPYGNLKQEASDVDSSKLSKGQNKPEDVDEKDEPICKRQEHLESRRVEKYVKSKLISKKIKKAKGPKKSAPKKIKN
jgi:hypothetical protein